MRECFQINMNSYLYIDQDKIHKDLKKCIERCVAHNIVAYNTENPLK